MQTLISQLEEYRQSRVLVFGSSQLEIDLLPALYDTLCQLGPGKRLDVVFYSRGGIVNAARRVALLLREFAPHISFLVPHYCESAGTVTALSANEIVAGPLAIFSPVDPLLTTGNQAGDGPLAVSAEDLRLFAEMTASWFGLEAQEAKARAMTVLCDNIFPSTLTSFYRTTLEVQTICDELLSLHLQDDVSQRKAIADKLIFGFHSHSYALTRAEMAKLGLPMRSDRELEPLLWSIASQLRESIGPGARLSADEPWQDALFATRHGVRTRQRSEEFPGRWQYREWGDS